MTEPKRMCGECTACCTAIPIIHPELNKPAHETCRHCSVEARCEIYSARPTPCRTFVCQWLVGYGELHDRPDQSGIIPDATYVDKNLGMAVILWEVASGALQSPYAQTIWKTAVRNQSTVLLQAITGKQTIIFPRSRNVKLKVLRQYRRGGAQVFTVNT